MLLHTSLLPAWAQLLAMQKPTLSHALSASWPVGRIAPIARQRPVRQRVPPPPRVWQGDVVPWRGFLPELLPRAEAPKDARPIVILPGGLVSVRSSVNSITPAWVWINPAGCMAPHPPRLLCVLLASSWTLVIGSAGCLKACRGWLHVLHGAAPLPPACQPPLKHLAAVLHGDTCCSRNLC